MLKDSNDSLTRAPDAAGCDLEKSPEVWLTAVTSQSADTSLTRTLTGLRVAQTSVRTKRVTLAQTCSTHYTRPLLSADQDRVVTPTSTFPELS